MCRFAKLDVVLGNKTVEIRHCLLATGKALLALDFKPGIGSDAYRPFAIGITNELPTAVVVVLVHRTTGKRKLLIEPVVMIVISAINASNSTITQMPCLTRSGIG